MREFLRHGALVFGGLVGANILTYVYYATVARALGVESAGLLMALLASILFLSLPGNVLAVVVAKVAADACARGDREVLKGLGIAATALAVPVALAVACTVALTGPAIARFFHTGDALVVWLAAAGLATTFPLAAQRAVLQGSASFGPFVLSNLIEAAGKVATGLVLLFALHGAGGAHVALAGYVVATAVAFGVNAVLTIRGGGSGVLPRLSGRRVRHLVVGVALPMSVLTAMTFADAVLVRHYLSAREAGLYNSAIALVGRAIVTVVQFVPTILLPRAAAEAAAGRSARRYLAAALALTAGAAGTIVAAVAAFPGTMVVLMAGPAFAGAAPLLAVYAVAMSALAGAIVVATYLIGIDRHGFAVPVAAIGVAEIAAITQFHPDLAAVVRIVLLGHAGAFGCCLTEAIISLRGPQEFVAPPEEVLTP
jgi:O-antigen/teichoic acid export membrane protein